MRESVLELNEITNCLHHDATKTQSRQQIIEEASENSPATDFDDREQQQQVAAEFSILTILTYSTEITKQSVYFSVEEDLVLTKHILEYPKIIF